ncbi:MAG TPA: hypothetical protein VN815_18960 [Steroidobacteraceae bacterium]|nr:hypothetical protein [Steroidobacteraceae bacterium]
MSLETYAERTKRWISTAWVVVPDRDDRNALSPEQAEVAAEEANQLIQRRIDDARLTAQIKRVHADVRRFWPIVPRGGKC